MARHPDRVDGMRCQDRDDTHTHRYTRSRERQGNIGRGRATVAAVRLQEQRKQQEKARGKKEQPEGRKRRAQRRLGLDRSQKTCRNAGEVLRSPQHPDVLRLSHKQLSDFPSCGEAEDSFDLDGNNATELDGAVDTEEAGGVQSRT